MDREEVLLVLAGEGLEDHGVGGDQRHVVVTEPSGGGDGESRARPAVGEQVACWVIERPAGCKVADVAGPDEHGIAGLRTDACVGDGGLEVLDADLVAGGQHVDSGRPGEVEQDASGHDRADLVDAEARRALLVDLVGRVAVVEAAIHADVGQAIDVGGALHREGDDVLVERWSVRCHLLGHVDAGHLDRGVTTTFDEAHLDALGL